MAQNKIIPIGPVALTTTMTTNIANCNVTSLAGPIGFTMTQPYIILRHVHILNKTINAATFSLWVGATGGNVAGTEFLGSLVSVPGNLYFDWVGAFRLNAADFLVGGCPTGNTTLTFEAEAEIGLV